MSDKILEIKNLSVSYGGIKAVRNVNLSVERGKIVTLIGAYGAGKSTILRTISGIVKPEAGAEILYNGENIIAKHTSDIVKSGITLVPEGRRIFPNLTVLENLKIGAYLRKDDINFDLEHCYDLFPILKERAWQSAGTLSGGEQQMLAIARALMMNPKLIIMDEPSLGLAPIIVEEVFEIIRTVASNHSIAILIVEQNLVQALSVAHRGYVLENGRIAMEGKAQDLLHDPDINAK